MEKARNAKADEDKKRQDLKAGRQVGVSPFNLDHLSNKILTIQTLFQISGREMFYFNPELAAQGEDDDEGGEAVDYRQLCKDDDDEDGIQYREIVLDDIALEACEADNTGSVAAENRLKEIAASVESKVNGIAEGEFF
jgi:hypothetical protein